MSNELKEYVESLMNPRIDVLFLRARIIEKGYTYGTFCEKIGFSRSRWYSRIRQETAFTANEVLRISEALGLSKSDINRIFFGR